MGTKKEREKVTEGQGDSGLMEQRQRDKMTRDKGTRRHKGMGLEGQGDSEIKGKVEVTEGQKYKGTRID